MSTSLFQQPGVPGIVAFPRVTYVFGQVDAIVVVDAPAVTNVVENLQSAAVMEVIDTVCVYKEIVF